jgi:formylglycine-generating enzyme
MRNFKISFFGLSILAVTSLTSFTTVEKGKSAKEKSAKEIENTVVKITDKLYAGKYEVSNLEYLDFIRKLTLNNNADLAKQALPDTLNWRDKSAYNDPLVEMYFRNPAYSVYPVVNVSYNDANSFCKWLSDEYNSKPDRKFKKVLFRLPTSDEWEFAARANIEMCDYPWGMRLLQNDHYMCNYRHIGDENTRIDTLTGNVIIEFSADHGSIIDGSAIPAPVNSYYPNKFGMYNVCGNVAEMIKERGISRGGGWKSPGGDVKIKSKGHYSESANDLGFRYFMEVLEQ